MLRPLSAVCLRYDCPHGKYEQTIVRERAGFDDDAFEGVFLLDLSVLNASSETSATVSQVSGLHSGLGAPIRDASERPDRESLDTRCLFHCRPFAGGDDACRLVRPGAEA